MIKAEEYKAIKSAKKEPEEAVQEPAGEYKEPYRILATEVSVGDTVFIGGDAYIIYEESDGEYQMMSNNGSYLFHKFDTPYYNNQPITKEAIGSGCFSCPFNGIEYSNGRYKFTFHDASVTIKRKDGNVILYKGVAYALDGFSDGKIHIKNGSEEHDVKPDEVRVFLSEADLKTFIVSVEKENKKYEKQAEEAKKLVDAGYGKLDLGKVRSSEFSNYCNVDFPRKFVKIVAAEVDTLVKVRQNEGSTYKVMAPEFVTPITEAEFNKGEKEEKEAQAEAVLGERILKSVKTQLDGVTSTITDMEAQLVSKMREQSELIKMIHAGDYKEALKVFNKEMQLIGKHKNVRSVQLDGSMLRIRLKDLEIKRITASEYKKYLPIPVGDYNIDFDLAKNYILATAQTKKEYQVMKEHPHCAGTKICLGNMNNKATQLLADLRVYEVFATVIAVLEECNSAAYRHVGEYLSLDKLEKWHKAKK